MRVSRLRSPSVRLTAALAVVLATALPGNLRGQRATAPSAPRPGWLKRSVKIEGGITAAQRAEAVARLEKIEHLLLQVPGLANPQGFEILPTYYGGARRLGLGDTERKDYVVEYSLTLTFFVPTMKIAHEGCACIMIRVNPQFDPGERGIIDEQGRTIWIEMGRGDPIPVATQVYERLSPTDVSFVFVLLTPGRAAPWRQVTREEYYNAWLFEIEGKDGSKLAANRAALSKTRYQLWLEEAAQRKANQELSLRSMAAAQPAEAVAKFRKELEDTERQTTEQLKAGDASEREANQAALATPHPLTTGFRAGLGRMSAEERRMPAFFEPATAEQGALAATGLRVTDHDGPGILRALTPDYDYWRARRSPVEARGIQVHIGVSGSGTFPSVHRTLWQAFNTLDWAALYQLLDGPP